MHKYSLSMKGNHAGRKELRIKFGNNAHDAVLRKKITKFYAAVLRRI